VGSVFLDEAALLNPAAIWLDEAALLNPCSGSCLISCKRAKNMCALLFMMLTHASASWLRMSGYSVVAPPLSNPFSEMSCLVWAEWQCTM
jgi:hypothetical protein